MDTVKIRPATAADQALIRKLILQNNLNPMGLNWQRFIIATDDDDEFLGCGQIKQHGDTEELASLVVVKDSQGRGISRALMDALLKRGKRPLWLMCESHLIPYYKKSGFKEVKRPERLPHYFRAIFWLSKFTAGMMLLVRGNYVAFMVLTE